VVEVPAELLNASTRFCAVLGHPIEHSASPALQNAGFEALGLNWRYLAFEVLPENLTTAIAGARAMGFMGLNLTIPHKLLALEMVDVLHETARHWGAVNTIRFEGADDTEEWRPLVEFENAPKRIRSHGFNTDADAIKRTVSEDLGLKLKGSRVLVLGAGGAGRTAALKLAAEKVADLHIVNRTLSKAEALAAEVHQQYPKVAVHAGYPKGRVDLVINATSLGLNPADELPIDEAQLPLPQVANVFDMIYRPIETPLLSSAKAAGCQTVNGLSMLLYQGAAALEIWTGRKPPLQKMRHELERHIHAVSIQPV
jgi:shikimate dehydrogenase